MGTHTTGDALMQVYRRLRDTASTADEQLLTDSEIEDFIRQATSRYSSDRPQNVVEDIDADGTKYLPLPSGFVESFSVIRSIEYPIDYNPPSYLDARDVDFYRVPAVVGPPAVPSQLKVRCTWISGMGFSGSSGSGVAFGPIPAGTKNVRIAYTLGRGFGDVAADTTVLDIDFYAVCDLAASNCCDSIAIRYGRLHEPILGAGRVAMRDKADIWTERAKRYEARYLQALGSPLATAVINWDSNASWWGGTWLNHPSIRR